MRSSRKSLVSNQAVQAGSIYFSQHPSRSWKTSCKFNYSLLHNLGNHKTLFNLFLERVTIVHQLEQWDYSQHDFIYGSVMGSMSSNSVFLRGMGFLKHVLSFLTICKHSYYSYLGHKTIKRILTKWGTNRKRTTLLCCARQKVDTSRIFK